MSRVLLLMVVSSAAALSSTIPHEREVFSVAPMMAHTNRHYHTFFRMLSQRAHLYTEMVPATQIVSLYNDDKEKLEELLRRNENNVILQLGGRDATILAQATAIGASYGYAGINLNCGCPSNAVSGRCGGASLMRDASHVATIVESMSNVLQDYNIPLSVKHRLGVAEAGTYDAAYDHEQDDEEAYKSCLDFCKTITLNGDVKKVQVHGRLALLGDFEASEEEKSALWVPGEEEEEQPSKRIKVDHKRVQYQAKKRARLATIKNRSVPPLRPNVVNELALTLPKLEFVTNGGIHTMDDVHDRLVASPPNMIGAMVGRAAINHPCAFAGVDALWGNEPSVVPPTRGQVLQAFADYCAEEEERLQGRRSPSLIEALRRRLVAVPFTLFMGEEGNNAYQRRIRKLISRPQRHSARSILLAAMSFVPSETLDRPVSDFSLEVEDYSKYNPRSGPLQRSIL